MKSPLRSPSRRSPKATAAELAQTAAQLGDYATARNQLLVAIANEPKNASLRLALALVHEKLGEPGEMAVRLAEALRLKPSLADAARWLSALAGRFRLSSGARLDPTGLKAALECDLADQQLLTIAAFDQLKVHGALRPVLADVIKEGADPVARRLLLKRTDDVLKDDLLLTALTTGFNADPAIETLLTALRKVLLLELPAERFEERSVNAFAVALASQLGWNGHVFAETAAERERIATLKGDPAAANRSLLLALYLSLENLLAVVPVGDLRPKALREALSKIIAERAADEAAALELSGGGRHLPEIGAAGEGWSAAAATARWSGLQAVTPGAARATLNRYAGADRLEFMNGAFDVLVAGAGSGKQALQAAMGYGPVARMTAIDRSATALAFAARKAKAHGIGNVGFMVAGVDDVAAVGGPFDIIEAVGVLERLADPLAGLRGLIAALKPHGLIYVGLPSRAALKPIADLLALPDAPAAGASDSELRTFRGKLLKPTDGTALPAIAGALDFYTLANVRDLVAAPRRPAFDLSTIKVFLEANGLVFLGFVLDQEHHRHFSMAFPTTRFPGSLDEWASHEEKHPAFFGAGYRFWARRA